MAAGWPSQTMTTMLATDCVPPRRIAELTIRPIADGAQFIVKNGRKGKYLKVGPVEAFLAAQLKSSGELGVTGGDTGFQQSGTCQPAFTFVLQRLVKPMPQVEITDGPAQVSGPDPTATIAATNKTPAAATAV